MMTQAAEKVRSWFADNIWLVVGQIVTIGGAFAALFAYGIRLEHRVYTMEHRGAEYTVARLAELQQRITILEQQSRRHEASIIRIVDVMTRELGKPVK